MASHSVRYPDARALPPLNVLQDALRKTTEVLAREVARPSSQQPRWSEFEWHIAEAAAVVQGISAMLANVLRWRGPDRWEAFLACQKYHTRERQLIIEQLLTRIDREAQAHGIATVALKGAALHRIAMHPLYDRPMSDVDLLVAPQNFSTACSMITSLGYREGLNKARHLAFDPPEGTAVHGFGEHERNPVRIELHTRIAEELPLRQVDITSRMLPLQAHAGINPYPSSAALMCHLLLHAAGNMRARALRFVQLYDIARLGRRLNLLDWAELTHDGAQSLAPWWAFAPLVLTARYFPNIVPTNVIRSLESGCPWALRKVARAHTITDVSWSRLYIQAFPGIEWSGSAGEALRFMSSRIFPKSTALTETWNTVADRPFTAAVPWYGLSHPQRILRWVFSNPPRVQTIYPIRVALGIQNP